MPTAPGLMPACPPKRNGNWPLAAAMVVFIPGVMNAPDETRALFNATFDDLQPVNSLTNGISPFEVYGLAGSVWEWVADEYSETFYAESPAENPANISEFRVTDRVLRGGGYASAASELRSTYRASGDPLVYQNIPDVGFRCASSVVSNP